MSSKNKKVKDKKKEEITSNIVLKQDVENEAAKSEENIEKINADDTKTKDKPIKVKLEKETSVVSKAEAKKTEKKQNVKKAVIKSAVIKSETKEKTEINNNEPEKEKEFENSGGTFSEENLLSNKKSKKGSFKKFAGAAVIVFLFAVAAAITIYANKDASQRNIADSQENINAENNSSDLNSDGDDWSIEDSDTDISDGEDEEGSVYLSDDNEDYGQYSEDEENEDNSSDNSDEQTEKAADPMPENKSDVKYTSSSIRDSKIKFKYPTFFKVEEKDDNKIVLKTENGEGTITITSEKCSKKVTDKGRKQHNDKLKELKAKGVKKPMIKVFSRSESTINWIEGDTEYFLCRRCRWDGMEFEELLIEVPADKHDFYSSILRYIYDNFHTEAALNGKD